MMNLKDLTRPNIWNLTPYSSARTEYSGNSGNIFLDANENPYNSPYNRYPDPLQIKLKESISKVKCIPINNIFLGNGSDEAIDLLYRCFTRPGIDNVVAIEPTYGMYKVCANINDIEYRPVQLDSEFQLHADRLLKSCDKNTKLIWICSPNNPTGNNLQREEIKKVLENFQGLVIIDEAYSDFSDVKPFRKELNRYPNMIVLNTMSKAWGEAAIRLGMAFASEEIINLFNKVKYPYNISALTQNQAIKSLKDPFVVERWVKTILQERARVVDAIKILPICKRVYPTNANFFLAEFDNANNVYQYLINKGIIVRNRSRVTLCNNCLRVTIGTKTENNELLAALRQY